MPTCWDLGGKLSSSPQVFKHVEVVAACAKGPAPAPASLPGLASLLGHDAPCRLAASRLAGLVGFHGVVAAAFDSDVCVAAGSRGHLQAAGRGSQGHRLHSCRDHVQCLVSPAVNTQSRTGLPSGVNTQMYDCCSMLVAGLH
jgi:hypothetical protein